MSSDENDGNYLLYLKAQIGLENLQSRIDGLGEHEEQGIEMGIRLLKDKISEMKSESDEES